LSSIQDQILTERKCVIEYLKFNINYWLAHLLIALWERKTLWITVSCANRADTYQWGRLQFSDRFLKWGTAYERGLSRCSTRTHTSSNFTTQVSKGKLTAYRRPCKFIL